MSKIIPCVSHEEQTRVGRYDAVIKETVEFSWYILTIFLTITSLELKVENIYIVSFSSSY